MIKSKASGKVKRAFLAGASLFLALFIVAAAGIFATISAFGPQNIKVAGVLEGFNPDSKLSYRIFRPGDESPILSGETVADDKGHIALPAVDKYTEMALTYDLSVQEDQHADPLNFIVNLGARDGKIMFQGKGLEQFSDVVLKSPAQTLETRSDWAGIIKSSLNGSVSEGPGSEIFEIALHGNFASDADSVQNPKIIKVFQAPGGGGPTPPVNEYIASHCGNNYSWCNSGAMATQINYMRMNYVRALMLMTEQFSAVMMQQAQIIGSFFDAQLVLKTQRHLQILQAEAHKDYHPSEQMCQFGSFMKTIARTEQKASLDKMALSDTLNASYTSAHNSSSAEGYAVDITSRIVNFRQTHCDPSDNNDGLSEMCDHDQNFGAGATGAATRERMNKDVDFMRTLGAPLTVGLDFNNPSATASADEEDIIALARNLYWPRALDPGLQNELPKQTAEYIRARNLMATQNVAHTSFANLAALKAQSETGAGAVSGWNYMKSMMRDFGITDAEIHQLLGNYPSYYAQMDVLTKKIYQNPDFYTNLYDKPANVERIGVTLEAIKLMQGRDMFESALRREMLTSLMVEDALGKHVKRIDGRTASEIGKFP